MHVFFINCCGVELVGYCIINAATQLQCHRLRQVGLRCMAESLELQRLTFPLRASAEPVASRSVLITVTITLSVHEIDYGYDERVMKMSSTEWLLWRHRTPSTGLAQVLLASLHHVHRI